MPSLIVNRKNTDSSIESIIGKGHTFPFRVIQESDFKKKNVSFFYRLNQKIKNKLNCSTVSLILILSMILFLQLFFAPAHVRKRRNKLWKKHADKVSETFNQKQKELSEQLSFNSKDLYAELYEYLNVVDKDHHKKEIDELLARHYDTVKPLQKDIDNLVDKILKQGEELYEHKDHIINVEDKLDKTQKSLIETEKRIQKEKEDHEEHHSVLEKAAENALLDLARKEVKLRESILARVKELDELDDKIKMGERVSHEHDIQESENAFNEELDRFCGECPVFLRKSSRLRQHSTCNERVVLIKTRYKRTDEEAKKTIMMEFPDECIRA